MTEQEYAWNVYMQLRGKDIQLNEQEWEALDRHYPEYANMLREELGKQRKDTDNGC